MISIENKFIFTHIGRTAGGSIELALNKYGQKKPHEAPYFLNSNKAIQFTASQHWTSLEERLALGDSIWDQCFKFTIVRNPWDRILSQYKGHVTKEVPVLRFEEYLNISFKEKKSHDDMRFISPCMDWITDSNGNILVDYIGKFENLKEDFNIICKKINIPDVALPHINKNRNKESYRPYYTNKSAELVANAFAKDIMEFNYEF